MAAVTAGVITAGAAAASAASSIKGAKEQERQNRRANARFENAALRDFFFSGPGGMGGSFNQGTGRLNLNLGERLEGQQGLFDALAQGIAGRDAGSILDPARGTLGLQQLATGLQPQQGDFSGLQNLISGNLGLADFGINQAFDFQQGANAFADRRFGQAENFFNEAAGGGSEGARARTLDLLRQQAAPFEDRAFTSLLDNQFATGRLGSTGGALQTEAFARGLGQADLSRQLAANQEGRNFQQNALGLAAGFQGAGTGARTLGDNLLGNAFGRFSGLSNLALDAEGQRFGQQLSGQQNLFNQLGSLFTQQVGLAGTQRGFESQDLGNIMRLFSFANNLQNIPLNFLNAAAGFETARSNAELGIGTSQLGVQRGGTSDAFASAFGGLAGAGQNGSLESFLGALGGLFGGGNKPSVPPIAPPT